MFISFRLLAMAAEVLENVAQLAMDLAAGGTPVSFHSRNFWDESFMQLSQ